MNRGVHAHTHAHARSWGGVCSGGAAHPRAEQEIDPRDLLLREGVGGRFDLDQPRLTEGRARRARRGAVHAPQQQVGHAAAPSE